MRERWQKMSLAQQMGNIGSEFSRMISLKQKGDFKNAQNSFFRILELIDLTIKDKRWQGRLFEILRLREVLSHLFLDYNNYNVSIDYLKKYFLQFALIANK